MVEEEESWTLRRRKKKKNRFAQECQAKRGLWYQASPLWVYLPLGNRRQVTWVLPLTGDSPIHSRTWKGLQGRAPTDPAILIMFSAGLKHNLLPFPIPHPYHTGTKTPVSRIGMSGFSHPKITAPQQRQKLTTGYMDAAPGQETPVLSL
jgi:hypothetical protein